ncbi:MAG: serine--tRNA ligase [Gammaproteobacteria bacterium AqS3]|nr:serine--tRNA ligase [Gammaproteobacteria bacterium AqS3]
MIDLRLLREDPEGVAAHLKRRGYILDIECLLACDRELRALETDKQERAAERNSLSRKIGEQKRQGGDAAELLAEVERLDRVNTSAAERLGALTGERRALLDDIPNLPADEAPEGADESANVEVERWGEIPEFDFEPRDHIDLGTPLGLDLASASAMSGARFSVMWGALAQLHRALIQHMIALHTGRHGYTEVYVPSIVSSAALYGSGKLPKFAEDLFRLHERDLYLIPTAEVALAHIGADRIFAEGELPLKMVSHTPCYRSEAGSYGRDTRGVIRQHQFEKVELVQWVRADESAQALDELRGHAEAVLRSLELPYRVVELCCGDLGTSAARTFDLEVWMPGQSAYREISSCSNCTDFQARRLRARRRGDSGTELLHSLNGSGLAVGRTLVALIENGQRTDGSVSIPEALRPWMDGRELLEPEGPGD